MNRYENYNPEIIYSEESTNIPRQDISPLSDGEQPKEKTTVKRKSPRRQAAKKEAATSDAVKFSEKIIGLANSQNLRLILGLVLGGLAIYMSVSFISYIADCFKDQPIINNSPIGQASGISNNGGEGGARLSEFLINECFGLGSFVIILWLGAFALKLLVGKPRFKSVNFTIKCMVALLTLSLIVGLLTIGLNTSVNWGGYHGRYVNQFIIDFIGWSGAAILCVVLIASFVVICLRDIVNWINRYRKKIQAHRRAIAEEKARKAEEERIINEMRLREQQDDMNAGDAENIKESVAPEAIDDSKVSFAQSEGVGFYEEISDDEVKSVDTHNDQDSTLSPAESVELNASSDAEDSDSAGLESEENGDSSEYSTADDDKMVVNVNQIAKADNPGSFTGADSNSSKYKFPPLDILRQGEDRIAVDAEEQIENKEKIRKTLLDFDVPIVSISATVGPTLTLYEIRPDKGQKVSKIKGLVDDISLSLSAIGVRIIAPIPGKGTVGIEVANKDPQMVSMRQILQSRKYQESKYKLPVALGSTISNEVYIADLTKMPHMLVAGATGQGKSVGLNVIIASLLYRKKPHELKFVMVDPKMVEFSLYAKIEKHYLAKMPGEDKAIITDMSKAVATLNSLVQEMEDRYRLLEKSACRNIEEYNSKWNAGRLNPKDGHKFMPYIVAIVDEFADLMMTAGKEVEKPIARLAQKARAVGIHEIIATQRPATTVITGNIKANFLTRVAFKVSSGIDSKTILDTTGAQQLIGRGDMLISNNSEMTRVQCAFIDTPEVEALTEYIASQPYGGGAYILPEPPLDGEAAGPRSADLGEKDTLFVEIGQYVVNTGYGSTSDLQRKFSLGYNRAGKIMDQLESVGIVGPSQGGKRRSVLVSPQEGYEILKQFE